MKLKLQLTDYLEAQLRAPFPEKLLDDNKQALVICHELVYRNVTYHGPDSRKWHSEGQRIGLPASEAKRLCREYKIKLIVGADPYRSGLYNYHLVTSGEKQIDGFSPWDWLPNDYPDVPRLEPSEYDDCWVPVRQRERGTYGPIFFLPYGLVQRLPLRGDLNWEQSSMIIDLAFEASMRHRLAPA
jgi:hypothetical protein